MQVTITGGAGFIGTNVAAEWAERGARVVVLDNLSRRGVEANLEWLTGRFGDRVRFIKADAADPEAANRSVQGSDVVYHFASQVAVTTSLVDPMLDFRSNAESALVMLEATRHHAPEAVFFYTSTNKVYGEMEDVELQEGATRYSAPDWPNGIDESRPLDFHSPYGCSKGAGDQYTHDYARIFGLRTVVFRMSCIYGVHQWGNEDQGWVMHFARSVCEGRPITVCGDGKQVRDVLFITDLVDAFFKAYEAIDLTAGEVFNIGGGPANSVSLVELLEMLEVETCRKAVVQESDWRAGDQRYYCSDTSKALELFGWKPTVSPEEGVRRILQWLKDRELKDV
jgi:CDP-paratose 2-epimerase